MMRLLLGVDKPWRCFWLRNKPGDIPFCGVSKQAIESARPTLSKKGLRSLYEFVCARYEAHINKDVLEKEPPWTDDSTIQKYRFTNVRREHDKETKWLIKHISCNTGLCYEDKLLNTILFRLYNRHDTAELLSMPIKFSKYELWDPEWYRSLFEAALVENPERKFFTGAFSVSGLKRLLSQYVPINIKNNSMEMRMLYFMETLIEDRVCGKLRLCKSPIEIVNTLMEYDGIGDFLAYQIFVDMSYISEFPFSENEFTIAGPGCMVGLDFLFVDRGGMSYEECLFWLRDNIDSLFTDCLNKPWDAREVFWDLPEYDRCFNVMSLENCFCELGKYIQAKQGVGRHRKKYVY